MMCRLSEEIMGRISGSLKKADKKSPGTCKLTSADALHFLSFTFCWMPSTQGAQANVPIKDPAPRGFHHGFTSMTSAPSLSNLLRLLTQVMLPRAERRRSRLSAGINECSNSSRGKHHTRSGCGSGRGCRCKERTQVLKTWRSKHDK